MKLSKAIEIIEKWYAGDFATGIENMNPAVGLAIEAMKAWQEHREHHLPRYRWPLPGETEG